MPTYLITSQEIKTNTPMGGNVDSDNIMSLIYDAQRMVLEPILGTKLYDYIIANYNAPLTGLYLQMYEDYIKQVLWHSVYADYLRVSNVIASNGGTFTNQPDNASTSNLDEVRYIAKNYQSKADSYIEGLNRFLCSKMSEIPEYTYNQDNDYDINPDNDISTIGGWFLDGDDSTYNGRRLTGSGGGSSGNYIELE